MARRPQHPTAPPRSDARRGADGNRNAAASSPVAAFLAEEDTDRRRLRTAIAVAVAFHALLLVLPSPRSAAVPAVEEEPPKLMVVQQVRFKPPVAQPEPLPERRATRVPIPDPTPDEPEPIRPFRELRPDPSDLPVTDVVEIPDGPPPPVAEEPLLVGGEIARPEGLHTPDPPYTEIARKTRIEGTVILQLTLDRQGEVEEVKVLKGLPMGLTEAARDTVATWRYRPATLNGRPVPVYMVVTVRYSLD